MDQFDDLSVVRHVQPGDPVASKPTSQPTRALELRLKQIEDQLLALSQSTQFSKFIIPNVPIKIGDNAVLLDDIIYYNAATGLYEKAIAGVTIISGTFEANPTALALGVCVAVNGAFGDVMIAGYDTWRDDAHKANMMEPSEEFIPGVPYYLSATDLGKLTRFPPAIQIKIMVATAQHYVLEPIYGIPDSTDNPTRQAIGMRPVGGIRKNPDSFEQYVIVAFDALELITPDPGHAGYGVWRSTADGVNTIYNAFGYLIADAQITQQPAFPVYARISVDTSGNIKACQASTLAHTEYSDSDAYNKVSSFIPMASNAFTVRNYPLFAADGITSIGTLYFKFTATEHLHRRDIIFKIPDSFQGWKMINPPIRPSALAVVSGGKVVSIIAIDAGIGLDIPPVVEITGDGSGATAVAVLDGFGSITSFNVTNQGTGYSTAGVILHKQLTSVDVLNAGDGATAVAVLGSSPGPIASVTVMSPGSGYMLPPNAVVVDTAGTGSGAVLNPVVVNGLVARIDVLQHGSNYTAPVILIKPAANRGYKRTKAGTYSFTLGGGIITAVTVIDGGFGQPEGVQLIATNSPPPSTPAVFAPILDDNGAVIKVNITSGGTGYTAPTMVTTGSSDPTFAQPGDDIMLHPATATIQTLPMKVERVDVICSGAAYASNTTIAFDAPTGGSPVTATGYPIIDINGHIAQIVVTEPGSGYEEAPVITITDPGGNGNHAILKARVGTIVSGVTLIDPGDLYFVTPTVYAGTPIDHVEMVDIGSGYSGTPAVTIGPSDDDNFGVQATAVALMGQQIASVIIGAGGTGYTNLDNWSIVISGGGGTGAVLVPIFSGGVMVDIQIVNPGYGYTSAPSAVLTLTGPGAGAGAAFTLVMEGLNCVVGIKLTNAGTSYGKPPSITIDSPGGAGVTARASAKMSGTGAILQSNLSGSGGLQFGIGSSGTGNGLQIYNFAHDLSDNISAPLRKPIQGVLYYNIKADPLLHAKYPSIPPERSLFMLNGTELNGTIYNELTGLSLDIDADIIYCRKSPIWTTFDVSGCPWDIEYRPYVVDLNTNGADHIIPKSGPFGYEASWFRFWEHVYKYEVSRNRAWLHLNRGSRFYQTGRVLSLSVLPPFKLTDVATGAEVKNDGTPATGQLLLTIDGESPFLTGNTGVQLDLASANSLVVVYQNNLARPIMISSIVLEVAYQANTAPSVLPTVNDVARVTLGTQAGNYRDIIGTIDPSLTTQEGALTQLYAQDQVKELFPDDRDSAPLIVPGQQVFLRVDAATSGNILAQLVTTRIKGYIF